MIEKKHTDELNRIITSIKAGNGETKAFSDYLTELCAVDDQSYSPKTWPIHWRKSVYSFGSIFTEQDAGPYLKETNQFLDDGGECEIAAFFSSEIIWNYYEEASEYNKTAIKSYIKLFPHNPEFHNNYGLFLAANHNFKKALDEHKVAIRLNDDNGDFIGNYTLAVKQYFEYLLSKNNPDKAEALIKDAIDFVRGTKYSGIGKWEQMSRLNSLRDRLNDFQIVLDSVSKFKGDIEAKIRGEQKRLIEVLGIFSAVIAFILTNIAIAMANLTVVEVLSLMFGMSLVLIIFAASISILFSPRRGRHNEYLPFLKDNRFWTILFLVFTLLAWVFLNDIYFTQGNEVIKEVEIADKNVINEEEIMAPAELDELDTASSS
jgi:tetratricopeptide (TPR) repeat protein